MKKLTFLLCTLLLGVATFAQAGFGKGYIVGLDGARVECLIKNNDWVNSPVIIKYRLTESGEVKEGNPKTVKEFGITTDYGVVKYIGSTVQIDKSLDASKI